MLEGDLEAMRVSIERCEGLEQELAQTKFEAEKAAKAAQEEQLRLSCALAQVQPPYSDLF